MDALFKIPSSEFNEEVFKKIKSLIKSLGNAEITIAINNKPGDSFRNESKEEYWIRLNKSITDIEQGNGIVFTMDELENYIHEMPGK
jgi:hypothetical protein